MTDNSSATLPNLRALSPRAGLWWGLLGIVAFSFTVPFTRLAVEGMPPLFVGAGRAVVAALLAAVALACARTRLPEMRQWARLGVVAGGVVVGFPILTSFALTTVPASHGAVVIGLLPAATAVAVVLRSGERPAAAFWISAILGAVAAVVFASLQDGGLGLLSPGDLLLAAAVLAAALGYAEGGLLARELGAWQTVSWALVLSSPVMIALTLVASAGHPISATLPQWLAFAYLGVVSMFLGFFAWYRGLAIGPMAQVSQVQLLQPVMTIAWAALILGEQIGSLTIAGAAAVILCAATAVRTRWTGHGAERVGPPMPAPRRARRWPSS